MAMDRKGHHGFGDAAGRFKNMLNPKQIKEAKEMSRALGKSYPTRAWSLFKSQVLSK